MFTSLDIWDGFNFWDFYFVKDAIFSLNYRATFSIYYLEGSIYRHDLTCSVNSFKVKALVTMTKKSIAIMNLRILLTLMI